MIRWIPLLVVGCSGSGDGDPSSDGEDTDVEPIPWGSGPFAPITPTFQFEDIDFEGSRVTVHIPENPVGLLFVFHGTDGDIASVSQIEWIELYDLLVPQGVGIVLSSSVDRVERVWDSHDEDPATNDDFPRLSRLRDQLIETTAVDADTPILSIGFSNGANYALVFTNMAHAEGWDVRGFSSHQGGQQVTTLLPGIYASAENDELSGQPDNMAPLADLCSDFTQRTCPHYVGHEIPLDPEWFARMPYYTVQQSQAMFDELVGMGIVDSEGGRLTDLLEMESVFETYLATSQAPSPSWIPTQLRVVWATHRFSSEHAAEEAAWLVDQL